MKRTTLLAFVLALTAACDSDKTAESKASANAGSAAPPTKSEIADEVASGVKDQLQKRGPKWKVDYKGDLSGHVEGGVLTAMGVSSSISAVGAAMTKDSKGKAPEGLSVTILNANTDTPNPVVTLKLADGTKCTNDNKKGFPKIKLIDKERKTFHAELEGALVCGEQKDKSITFSAVLKKK